MELGEQIDPKMDSRLRAGLGRHLGPGERALLAVRTEGWRPALDLVVVTDRRLLGIELDPLAREGPRLSFTPDQIRRVATEPRIGAGGQPFTVEDQAGQVHRLGEVGRKRTADVARLHGAIRVMRASEFGSMTSSSAAAATAPDASATAVPVSFAKPVAGTGPPLARVAELTRVAQVLQARVEQARPGRGETAASSGSVPRVPAGSSGLPAAKRAGAPFCVACGARSADAFCRACGAAQPARGSSPSPADVAGDQVAHLAGSALAYFFAALALGWAAWWAADRWLPADAPDWAGPAIFGAVTGWCWVNGARVIARERAAARLSTAAPHA